MKYLVLFNYYETNKSKINLNFFIENGVYISNLVTFIIVIKGDILSVNIPKFKNVIVQKTSNEGYDFGGWSDGLKLVNLDNYDRFIFLNDTVRGPYLPSYLNKKDWVKYFTRFLNSKIKLTGSTINCTKSIKIKNDHIQSMSFATDKIGLNLLIKNNIFNKKLCQDIFNQSKWNFITQFEVRMSEVIMNEGYDIKSLQFFEQKGDIQYINNYKGTTVNPLEIMFIKTNRINDGILKNYTKWNMSKKTDHTKRNNIKLLTIIITLIFSLLIIRTAIN